MEENPAQHEALLVTGREFTSSAQHRSFQIGLTGLTWTTKEQMEHEQICLQKNLVLRASTPCTAWMSHYSDRLCSGPGASFLPAVRFHLLCAYSSSPGFTWSARSGVCVLWERSLVGRNTEWEHTATTLTGTHPQTTKNNSDKMYWGQERSFKQHKQELLKELSTQCPYEQIAASVYGVDKDGKWSFRAFFRAFWS